MTTYTPEQITENRRKWIAALRSGEHRQHRGSSTDGNGAGCAVHVAGVLSGCSPSEPGYIEGTRFLGIRGLSCDGEITGGELARWNDNARMSFAQIADRAEAMWFPKPCEGTDTNELH